MENVPNAENLPDLSLLSEDFANNVSENEKCFPKGWKVVNILDGITEIKVMSIGNGEVAKWTKEEGWQEKEIEKARRRMQEQQNTLSESELKARQERLGQPKGMMQGMFPEMVPLENQKSKPTIANGGRPNPQHQFDQCHGIPAEAWESAMPKFYPTLIDEGGEMKIWKGGAWIVPEEGPPVKVEFGRKIFHFGTSQKDSIFKNVALNAYLKVAKDERLKKKSIRSFVASTWRRILSALRR